MSEAAAQAARVLPVTVDRLVDALRSEAALIARTSSPGRLARAAADVDDLAQAGALAYLLAVDRTTPSTRKPHAFAMASARGAMLDLLRHDETPADAPHRSLNATTEDSGVTHTLGDRIAAPAPHRRSTRESRGGGLLALPRRVRRAIGRLSAPRREAVRLFLADLTPQQIAARFGITPNAASLRRHQALTALRERFAPLAAASSRDSSGTTNPHDGK